MDVQINVWGVLAATAAAMVIGSIWYSNIGFGKQWMKLEGLSKDSMKGNPTVAMVGMAVLSLLMAYILAHVAFLSNNFYVSKGYSFQTSAITTGFWMWLGFVFPVVASSSLFSQKPWKLTAIHAGNWLVTLLAMGIVIGAIGL